MLVNKASSLSPFLGRKDTVKCAMKNVPLWQHCCKKRSNSDVAHFRTHECLNATNQVVAGSDKLFQKYRVVHFLEENLYIK